MATMSAEKPAAFITGVLKRTGVPFEQDNDLRKEAGTTTYAQSFTALSQSALVLRNTVKELQARSSWEVINLSRTSEFVDAKRGATHLWRLRVSMTAPKASAQTWIQIDGPSATLGYVDYLAFGLIATLIVSFGSFEQNRNDPLSFPPGMHPFVIGSQIVLASVLVCWIYLGWLLGSFSWGFYLITFLAIGSLSWWFTKSVTSWRGRFNDSLR